MAEKIANLEIGCNVHSCAFHCGRSENCSLPGINVECRPGCDSGCARDESLCASYKAK